MTKACDRIGSGEGMEVAADLVWPDLHLKRVLPRSVTALDVATRPDDLDEEKFVTSNKDLAPLNDMTVDETFDENVHKGVLVVIVQDVGEAGGCESNPSGQNAVLGVGEEIDHGCRTNHRHRRHIGWKRTR
jgi:hypothetical protein